VRYDTPAEEFLLRRFDGAPGSPVSVPDGGPRIVLCTAGKVCVRSLGGELEIGRGASLWLNATDTDVTIEPLAEGTQLFLASDSLVV
jgi:mannose-6-phosphate isomerase